MEKSTTTAGVFPAAIVEEAWQQVGASFERFCLTAGIAALAGMMEGDAARGDRLHRGADACPRLELGSAALSIGGKANLTMRSRQGGRMRSRQSRSAVGSPTSASSTALRVNASASPARNAAEQRSSSCCGSRPGGRRDCPTGPSRTGRPRTRPGRLGVNPSVIGISLVSTRRALWASRSMGDAI